MTGTTDFNDWAADRQRARNPCTAPPTFRLLQRKNDTSPSIHNTLAQCNQVLIHVIGWFASRYIRRGFQDLRCSLQVFLKMSPNGLSYVAKAL